MMKCLCVCVRVRGACVRQQEALSSGSLRAPILRRGTRRCTRFPQPANRRLAGLQISDTAAQHTGVLRLKEELAEKHERWLSCQRRCDIMQGQLASLCAAEEEVTRGKEALEKVQLERRELRREKLAAALKEQRTQNALQLREQMENLHREVEFEPTATIPAGRHTASEEAGGEKAGATRTARHAGVVTPGDRKKEM
ncbi:uncharacterized protein lekr1 isoform X3 [Gasterosteus aculeatus]